MTESQQIVRQTGLPDGIKFQTKNPNDVGTLDVHLVYFTAIWYILWPVGIFCGYLVYFSVLVYFTKENLATLLQKL
jgi:hypothetical protein